MRLWLVTLAVLLGLGVASASAGGLVRAPSWMSRSLGPTQHFRSAPDLRPPVVSATSDPDQKSGDIFLAPQGSPQVGPMILNARGQLVWFHPLKQPRSGDAVIATNLEVQHYQGHPVLTWWDGEIAAGLTVNHSEDVIMDRSYRTIATVHAGNGYLADLHEFTITPQGTALIAALGSARANLTSVGGPPDGGVWDDVIQDVDIRTGKVLWEWLALDHVPVAASYKPYSPDDFLYDYFHLNSIQQLPDGNLLISARNTWAVYEISRKTGEVIWTLGGKDSDFKMGSGSNFEWQHDARLKPHGFLSLFDDGSNGKNNPERQSSAKLLRVDVPGRTVSLIRRFNHSPPLISGAAGSAESLPNGDVFVGWGSQPDFSEYTPSGRQIFNGRFAQGVLSYRALRFRWVGRPASRPSLAVVPGGNGGVRLFASWNGATDVRAWRVLGGATAGGLVSLGVRRGRGGFETAIGALDAPRYFGVQALDGRGKVLGSSAAVPDPSHLAVFGSGVFVSSSGGVAAVPVGCLSSRSCRVRVSVSEGGHSLGRSGERSVRSYRGALVYVRVGGRSGGRAVVSVQGGSGLSARRRVTLVPYSAAGPARQGAMSGAAGAQIAAGTDFVSRTGRAGVLLACYSASPCRVTERLSVGGHVIARTPRPVLLGANELRYVEVQLDAAGRRMLARASGNRLSVRLRVSSPAGSTSGQVDLVRYG